MLFFVKVEAKGMVPLPPEQLSELVVKEWETIISYRQQGKILAAGGLAGGKGGCAIFNVESAEELHTLARQMPLFRFLDWEIIPLIPVEYALESAKQALSAVQASK